MKVLVRHREIPCKRIVEMVTDYLEGSLSRSQRRRFERHLAGCPHCTEYLAQIQATIRLSGRLRSEDLSPEMTAELGELYRRWREEEDGS
jgi:anti-sigma factor RsiW